MTVKDLVEKVEGEGWIKELQKGSNAIYKHPDRPGRLIVPMHPGDIPKGTLNDIMKKAGLKH